MTNTKLWYTSTSATMFSKEDEPVKCTGVCTNIPYPPIDAALPICPDKRCKVRYMVYKCGCFKMFYRKWVLGGDGCITCAQFHPKDKLREPTTRPVISIAKNETESCGNEDCVEYIKLPPCKMKERCEIVFCLFSCACVVERKMVVCAGCSPVLHQDSKPTTRALAGYVAHHKKDKLCPKFFIHERARRHRKRRLFPELRDLWHAQGQSARDMEREYAPLKPSDPLYNPDLVDDYDELIPEYQTYHSASRGARTEEENDSGPDDPENDIVRPKPSGQQKTTERDRDLRFVPGGSYPSTSSRTTSTVESRDRTGSSSANEYYNASSKTPKGRIKLRSRPGEAYRG